MNDTSPDWFSQVNNYHSIGLNLLPAIQGTKLPAVSAWKWWQYDRQDRTDFNKLFTQASQVNIAVVCGEGSGNLYCVDCERPELFKNFCAQVHAAGIGDTITVETARGGHIWLRSSRPVTPRTYDGWEIKGQGNYVLAPPSLHPSGQYYQLHAPGFTIAHTDILPFITLEFENVHGIPRLARAIYRGEGPTYKSRSERDQAFIASLVKAGFSDISDIKEFILSASYSSKFRQLWMERQSAAMNWLEHSLHKAQLLGDTPEYAAARQAVQGWRAWAVAEHWTGRTGLVDKSLFLAHLDIAERAGLLTYNASVRCLAESAQTSAMTASNGNKRLIDLGVLQRVPRENGKLYHADALTLRDEPPTCQTYTYNQSIGTIKHVFTCTTLACWEWAGLGKAARSIWELLCVAVLPDYATIAQRSGRAMRTVGRLMPKLIHHGLVLKTPEGYMANQDADFQAIAISLGVVAKASHRRARHLDQRQKYAEMVGED